MPNKILVTGAAGFIGYHVSKRLLERGDEVIGIDDMNSHLYNPKLKKARLNLLQTNNGFKFREENIITFNYPIEAYTLCHLGAQAGVRLSIEKPELYIDSNVKGTLNMLNWAIKNGCRKVVYASSSSVYGNTTELPAKESQKCETPVSVYATTKLATEHLAHSFSFNNGLYTTGLRFFTVYGPFGRPDMALFKFTKNILEGKPIEVFNNGQMKRDFTYIDDIVDGVISAIDHAGENRCEIFNLARGESHSLNTFISAIERHTGIQAKIKYKVMQQGDVTDTSGDITKARDKLGYDPKVSLDEGVRKFVEWYKWWNCV